MEFQKEFFGNELKRTLEWLSKHPKALTNINYSYPNEASLAEVIETIDMLIENNCMLP